MYGRIPSVPSWAQFTVDSRYGLFYASTLGTARSHQSYWGGVIKPL